MSLRFDVTSHCEVGLVRKTNQDSAYASASMLIVADGMGGAAAGDLASAVAIGEIERLDVDLADRVAQAATSASEAGGDADRQSAMSTALAATLALINDRLRGLVLEDPSRAGMGTTACGFALLDGVSVAVNIGDSRAYLWREGVLTRVTHDHSWVQHFVDAGRLTEVQAMTHPNRSLVLRVLNGKPELEPEYHALDLRVGDRVLVCSDGLCGLATDAQLAGGVSLPDRDAAVAHLISLAHAAGGHDNITILLADVVDDDAPVSAPVVLGAAADAQAASDTASMPAVASPAEPAARDARRGGGWGRLALLVLLPLALLLGSGFGFYSFAQTRYYIGPDADAVALFQGVPDRPLGLELSRAVERPGIKLADLPAFYRERVSELINVRDRAAGTERLAELRTLAEGCIAQRARPTPVASPSPAPTGTASPSASPSPAPTPSDPVTAASPQGC